MEVVCIDNTWIQTHYGFSRSKYFHLLIAPIEGFINLIE